VNRKRRALIVGAIALALAGAMAVGGFVMADNASFAADYTEQQLAQEKISFKPLEAMSERELAYTNARTGCAIAYAGQTVTTGRQAECFANEYLGGHLTYLATRLGMDSVAYADGMTFSELGGVQGELRTRIQDAKTSGDPALAALEEELAAITTLRSRIFEGSMLRGTLLTVYGFSVLGEKAGEAAAVGFLGAALLVLVSLLAFGYAFVTHGSYGRAAQRVRPPEETKPAVV
jgi:hypothetical protein